MGKKAISCDSEEEASYLKVFADLGFSKVAVPTDLVCLEESLPEIQKFQEMINPTISKELDRRPQLKTRRKQILLRIWRRLMEVKQ